MTSQSDEKRFMDTWNGDSASPLSSSQRVLGEIQIAVPLVEKPTLPGVGTNGVVDPTPPLLPASCCPDDIIQYIFYGAIPSIITTTITLSLLYFRTIHKNPLFFCHPTSIFRATWCG